MKFLTTRKLTKIAILSAIACILMLMDFSLPIFPSFYKLDFSEVAVLVGGFSMGPLAAICIEGLKIVLVVLFKGSNTAYVGEFANFLIGCSLVIPVSVIYAKEKTKKHALMGLAAGTIVMTVIGVLMNYFVLLPAYSFFYHVDMDILIGMGAQVIPMIHDRLSFVLLATTPFNIVKGLVVSLLTLMIYKRISSLLHR